ncbi:hypothetical protein [Hydrogenophilus thermoluteolus]|uniref:hypothetical protein n=1 Tax=Hydrogenophilus thermoluteolus TaxID=297 RepID=UPI003F678F36
MDLIEALSDRFAFQQSLYRETVDALAPPLAAAAEILAQTVLSGHRLWIVSGPGTHYLAAHFIERLWYGLERERPLLPRFTCPPLQRRRRTDSRWTFWLSLATAS